MRGRVSQKDKCMYSPKTMQSKARDESSTGTLASIIDFNRAKKFEETAAQMQADSSYA